jgi:predicted ATPase
MTELPTGTVTFLFTDIEGSTRLLDELGDQYAELLAEHHRLMRGAFKPHGGVEVDTQGDAFFVAFERASDAVAAAKAAQEALTPTGLRVRMGIHTGQPLVTETGYVGMDVHRAARIMSAGHGGQVLVSDQTHSLLDGEPRLTDVGAHRLKDLTEPQRLWMLGDGEFPPLKTLYQTNLPIQPTALIGREAELAYVLELLGSSRLVTLTGAGGSGKTRLALQAAAELTDEFKDGVWWVPLAAFRDPSLVEPTIAQAVGAKEGLVEHLRSKQTLLLLDNFEQLLDAASQIGALLAEAPDLRVLATSRERLGLATEREYTVPTMVPMEAVELFTARARQLKPGFQPDEATTEICLRLDGLPLAVELAAARIKVLRPAQILERLAHSLDLLTTGARDAPERHRTLRATIEWSHDLLDDSERQLFARLSVFAGSFDLEAGEAVCDADLDTLASLIDKSLLRQAQGSRFFLLETIREYGAEQLDRDAEGDGTRLRHARYFTELAERREPELRTSEQLNALAAFESEQPNLRVAIETAIRVGDAELESRLCAACWYFWLLRGNIREGLQRLGPALERSPSIAAQAALHEGLTFFMSLGGDAASAFAHADRALELRREKGEPAALLRALLNRGGAAGHVGDVDSARPYYEECLDTARLVGEPWYVAVSLVNLAEITLTEEEYEQAADRAREALAVSRELSDVHTAAAGEAILGFAELELGHQDIASQHFRSALQEAAGTGLPEIQVWCLVGIAALVAEEMPERAAAIIRAVEAWCGDVGYELGVHEQRLYDRVAAAEGGMAADAAMTLEEAVALASRP